MFISISLVALCLYFSFVDVRYKIIPNRITHPLLIITFVWRLFEPSFFMGLIPAGILLLLFLFRPTAIGEGDIKLFAIIGLVLGLDKLLFVCFVTFLLLFFTAIWIKCVKRKDQQYLAMAPYITIGVFVTVFSSIFIP